MKNKQDFTELKKVFLLQLNGIKKDLTEFIEEFDSKDPTEFEHVAMFLIQANCHINSYGIAARAFVRFRKLMDEREGDEKIEMPDIQELILHEATGLYGEAIRSKSNTVMKQ